MNHIIDANYKV